MNKILERNALKNELEELRKKGKKSLSPMAVSISCMSVMSVIYAKQKKPPMCWYLLSTVILPSGQSREKKGR